MKVKLFTEQNPSELEEDMNDWLASMPRMLKIMDIRYTAVAVGTVVEYSALVLYQC